jgi:hypothetical protein
VDLTHNKIKIEREKDTLAIFESLPKLKNLNLNGCPIYRQYKGLKYHIMVRCKQMCWIDQSRVNKRERDLAHSFIDGGYAHMRKVRLKMNTDRYSYEKKKRWAHYKARDEH